jgi:hypothetical protein
MLMSDGLRNMGKTKGIKHKGKWTEIFTRREKDIPGHVEASHGRDHGEGWACTCGCNKRVPGRKHREGPPTGICGEGRVVSTGANSREYVKRFGLIAWENK